MAIHHYIAPVIGTGGVGNNRRAQFVFGVVDRFIAIDYGNEPWMLVAAQVDSIQHAFISGQATVLTVPDLDLTVAGNLSTVVTELEGRGFPADWITPAMTYRTVLVWLERLSLIYHAGIQRLGAALERLFASGRTLDSTVGQIPAQMRTNLNAGAQSFRLDTSGITLAMPIRQALKILANQMSVSSKLTEFGNVVLI